jgi:signal transduction histidine kinase
MENVLIIGRIDSDKFALNPEKINLQSFGESLVDSIKFSDNNQHFIVYKFEGDENEINAEETLLGLIINNLLTNALKYSPKGSSVIMKLTCQNNKIIITIKDFGIGIPEKDLNHLFQSFYRASNVESIGGYGLGLSIVKKCVNTYNGKIEVQSKEAEGTTFTVTLPVL